MPFSRSYQQAGWISLFLIVALCGLFLGALAVSNEGWAEFAMIMVGASVLPIALVHPTKRLWSLSVVASSCALVVGITSVTLELGLGPLSRSSQWFWIVLLPVGCWQIAWSWSLFRTGGDARPSAYISGAISGVIMTGTVVISALDLDLVAVGTTEAVVATAWLLATSHFLFCVTSTSIGPSPKILADRANQTG